MKKIAVFLCFLTFLFTFSACHKAKDDRFDHKYPLFKTYLNDSKATPTIYSYEDEKLDKMSFPDGSYFIFSYEKKFQVNKITHYDMSDNVIEYANITFNEDHISEIQLFSKENVLMGKKTFAIENKKISKIVDYLPKLEAEKGKNSALFDMFFIDNQAYMNILQNQSKADLGMATTTSVVYTGDNITQLNIYVQKDITTLDEVGGNDTLTIDCTFDENPNPYYGLNFYCKSFLGYCANNPISEYVYIRTADSENPALRYKNEYNYVFDKHKNPTLIKKTTTNEDKSEEIIYIEYLSK
jgi:hypothetical protein